MSCGLFTGQSLQRRLLQHTPKFQAKLRLQLHQATPHRAWSKAAHPVRHRSKVLASCQADTEQQIHSEGQLGPDISQLKPHLQQQWDTAANSNLGNIVITAHSNKEVHWECHDCPTGHTHKWQAAVNSRSNGNGCPYCAGKAVCHHNSLAAQAPRIAAEWDFAANELTPGDYTLQSNATAAWKCSTCQYKWRSPIQRRTVHRSGCLLCRVERRRKQQKHSSLAAAGPAVMAFWDHARNERAGLDPNDITLCSTQTVHWLCTKCPLGIEHRWDASPHRRNLRASHPSGCPYCSGQKVCECNCLQTLYPQVAAEWDFIRNRTTPADHPASSRHVAWWLKSQRGRWQQEISARTRKLLPVQR